jgi:hypothetical protein
MLGGSAERFKRCNTNTACITGDRKFSNPTTFSDGIDKIGAQIYKKLKNCVNECLLSEHYDDSNEYCER